MNRTGSVRSGAGAVRVLAPSMLLGGPSGIWAWLGVWASLGLFVSVGINNRSLRADEASHPETPGVLRLINGNEVAGQLLAGADGSTIGWQADSFLEPFEFRFSAIKSIRFSEVANEQKIDSPFLIELVNGDLMAGRLLEWDSSSVVLRADGLGEFRVRPGSIRTLSRSNKDRQPLVERLMGVPDWGDQHWSFKDWRRDGAHLWTQQREDALRWTSELPPRSLIDVTLSWSRKPDWQIDIRGDRNERLWNLSAKDGRLTAMAGDTSVGNTSAEKTSTTSSTEFDLRQTQSTRLSLLVDAAAGSLSCFSAEGRLLCEVSTDEAVGSLSEWSIVNGSTSLRVERFRIASWLGPVPDSLAGSTSVAMSDGSVVCGLLRGYDAERRAFQMAGATRGLSADSVQVIQSRQFTNMAPQPQCALFLHDGQRISGDLRSITERAWVLDGNHFDRPVTVSRSRIRSMVVFNNDAVNVDEDAPAGRIGRLELGGRSLSGRLVPTRSDVDHSSAPDESAPLGLRWHPFGSRTSSALQHAAFGRIVYREPVRIEAQSMTAQALEMQRKRLQQQRRGLNFGELFLRRVDRAGETEPERDAHAIHTRTGDVIACRVESIDANGIRVSTMYRDNQRVPHQQIKAIELAAHSPPPNLDEAKRLRLLTIPRLQKSLPPTHLLCSYNGDFLRCRLLEMDAHQVIAEVGSKRMEIPRERISQIIWFHPQSRQSDELQPESLQSESLQSVAVADGDAAEAAGSAAEGRSLTGSAQVVRRDGKRVTFADIRVKENAITGVSSIVGPCQFLVSEIDQLVFGRQIASDVSQLAYNQWMLQPAIEPLVSQSTAATVRESPLIGLAAPDIKLRRLDGREFRLSNYRDRIVVLDFWASWCAPCMETMPKIESLISDQEAEEILLVAVNLEETFQQVAGVVERQQIGSLVVLDVDGAVASKFNVNSPPQWVVINHEGKVSAVHAGGGQEAVERLEKSIADLLPVRGDASR